MSPAGAVREGVGNTDDSRRRMYGAAASAQSRTDFIWASGEGCMKTSPTSRIRSLSFAPFATFATFTSCAALVSVAIGIGCVSPDTLVGETYTTIRLTNTLSIVRENEPVEIPISEIRSRFKTFDERDFSAHLLPTNWYPALGDPLLATDPAPEVPAQIIDTNLDGTADTLLVTCDFAAGEKRFVAIASPRFSRLSKKVGPRVAGGLWTRETVTREAGT